MKHVIYVLLILFVLGCLQTSRDNGDITTTNLSSNMISTSSTTIQTTTSTTIFSTTSLITDFDYSSSVLYADNCTGLKELADRLINSANKCVHDSDCKLCESKFGCPFGCHHIINKDSNITPMETIVDIYSNNCDKCEYDCPEVPQRDSLKCISGKCTYIKL